MGSTFTTTVMCAAFILVLEKYAPSLGLVDHPTDRKQHEGQIPLIGGLAIFCAIAITSLFFEQSHLSSTLILGGLLLIVLGIVDDVKNLSARFRLLVQFVIASLMFFHGDMRIESIGPILGSTETHFNGPASYLFTVFCTIGVINAINMIDGLDGLSGSLLLTSFLALAAIGMMAGRADSTALFVISGCLVSFLAYNNRVFRAKARIFLGDSGSMFLGLALTWYFVKMTQGEIPAMSAVSAGWIFGLPLMETISVMLGRLIDKRSPFTAGRDHMHHRLRRAGFSVNSCVAIMLFMHLSLVAVGITFAHSTAAHPVLFWLFVLLTVVHFLISRIYLEPMGKRAADTLRITADNLRKRRQGSY